MEPQTKYECPVCHKTYDTKEEAAACYRDPRTWVQPGDILRFQGFGYVMRIVCYDADGMPGYVAEHVPELRKAEGWDKPKDVGLFIPLVYPHWCKDAAKPYPLEEALELFSRRQKQLSAANEFLVAVKATHERHAAKEATGT